MFVSQIFEECAEILGTTDESKIFRKIQQAVATLMESGHWTHSVADVDVCTGWDRCSITLPRNIDVPLAVNIDGSPTYFRNRLFQYHVNKGGMFNSVEWAWDDRGYVATLMDIIQPSQLVAVAELENDVGKIIRVLGNDQNNRALRSQLANGTGVDGLLIPIHSQSDFAYGTIAPDDATVKTRSVAITPINLFTSTASHGLSSGQGMSVTAETGTIPVALENGQTYYIGVIDAFTVQLFNDPLNAQALNYPINLQSIVGAGNLEFKDSRESQVVTALQLSQAPEFTLETANQITFPTGQSLPSPLNSETIYYANAEDATHLTVFESENDAKKNINPVYTTGTTASLNVDIRKSIDPQTTLTFSVRHYYNDGDQVQAFTASGNLPKPLIANQNYFVNIIDEFSVSLHENQADALASNPTNLVNPIILKDSGSGTNSLVKLIPATSITGTTQQISASGLNIDTPSGTGANFQAVTIGSVTSVRVVSQGSGYVSDPEVTFSSPPILPESSPFYGLQRQATGYSIRDTVNNKVLNVVITDPGLGYTEAPIVTIEQPIQQLLAVTSITKVGATDTVSAGNLTGSGTTATCIINNHGYSDNQVVTISGATPSYYNGTFTINKIDNNTFTYTTLSTITTSPATGTIISTAYTGTVATATTNETHGYAVGDKVIITGASPSGFNGTKTILSVNALAKTFTYTVSSLLGSPATGVSIESQKISGSPATAVATITRSFVSHFNKISGGYGYLTSPQVKITGGGGSGAIATAQVNSSILDVNQISVSSGVATVTTTSPHGYDDGQTIEISDVTGTLATYLNGQQTITSVPITSKNISSMTRVTGGDIVTVVTSTNHNYSTGDVVRFSNVNPSQYANTPFVVEVYSANTFKFTITTTTSSPVLGASPTSYIPNSAATTFTFEALSAPNGTTLNAGITSTSGNVTEVKAVTAGSGYTTTPIVIITPSTGVFVSFTSTGSLPSPLVSGTAYRAETPLSSGNFTVKNTDFSDINITSSGTGTLYVSLSRAFSVTFNNNWEGDFTNLSTGQQIYFGTDYLLPATNPSIDNGITPFYLNKINNSTGKIYNTLVNANAGSIVDGTPISITTLTSVSTTATATTSTNHGYVAGNTVTITGATPSGYNKVNALIISTPALNQFTYAIDSSLSSATGTIKAYKTTGLIVVQSFGAGQSYYALRKSFQSLPFGNLITPSEIVFLSEDQIVRFSTTDTLPSPLVAGTDYTIKLFGDSIKVYLGGILQSLTTPGTGQLSLDILREFNVLPSTSIDADQAHFNTGDAVVPRAKEGDVLPTGLTAGTTYYARRIDNNSFELYDTLAQARNTASTTGRKAYTTTGETVESTFFIDSVTLPTFVKSVAQIDKPITEGYVSLYAYDYGRSNDMTLIGQYHPSEVNPQYRRIRIGKPCAWARISYRIQTPSITSIYDFIPLEQERAIITAVHACDLEDKDFADQSARYWQIAFAYLKNQQESIDGHAMSVPQKNAICYGDTSDPVMF